MRLIDADALHKALFAKQKWVVHYGDKHNEGYTSDQVHFAIDEMPTVDPIKHGHWVMSNGDYEWECSSCGHGYTDYRTTYCYDCGAKMDSRERKEDADT